jgi:hypothetical protein
MLTEKNIQAIDRMSKEDKLELLHICAEDLGLVSVKEFCFATGMARRTVYDHINLGKIKEFKISEHKFVLINYNL